MLTKAEMLKKSPAELRKMATDLGCSDADEKGKPELVDWIFDHQSGKVYSHDELTAMKAPALRPIATALGSTNAEDLGQPDLVKFIEEQQGKGGLPANFDTLNTKEQINALKELVEKLNTELAARPAVTPVPATTVIPYSPTWWEEFFHFLWMYLIHPDELPGAVKVVVTKTTTQTKKAEVK